MSNKPYIIHKEVDGTYSGGADLTNIPPGSADDPSISFGNANGIYLEDTNTIGITTEGALRMTVGKDGVISHQDGSGIQPSISINGGTGMYSKTHGYDDTLNFSMGGNPALELINKKINLGLIYDLSRDDEIPYVKEPVPFTPTNSNNYLRFKNLEDGYGNSVDVGFFNNLNNFGKILISDYNTYWSAADIISIRFKCFGRETNTPEYGKNPSTFIYIFDNQFVTGNNSIEVRKPFEKLQLIIRINGVVVLDRITTENAFTDVRKWSDVEVIIGSGGNSIKVDGVSLDMTDNVGTSADTFTIKDFTNRASSFLAVMIANGPNSGSYELTDAYMANVVIEETTQSRDNYVTRFTEGYQTPVMELSKKGLSIANDKLYPSTTEAEYYFKSGVLTDSSGKSRTLTVVGTPTYSTVLGKEAVTFTGTQYLYNNALGTSLSGDVCVLSMWFKTTSTTDGITLFNVDEIVTVTNNYLQILMRTGVSLGGNPLEGDIQIVNTPNRGYVTTNNGYNDGKWHHLVVNLLTTGFSIYIDGVSPPVYEVVGLVGDDQTLDASMTRAIIGSFNGSSNFVGSITNVVLSKTEITQNQALEIFKGFNFSGNNVSIEDLNVSAITTDNLISSQLNLLDGNQSLYNILVSNNIGLVSNAPYSSTEHLTGNYTGAYTGAADIQVSRIGCQVVMTFTDIGSQVAVATAPITYTSLSTQFRPLNTVEFPIRVFENVSIQTGLMIIDTNGIINIYSIIGGGAFTSGNTIQIFGTSMSWNIL